MNHNQHRNLQKEIVHQVLTILKNDEHLLGCVYAGSLARGEQDAFSDLDFCKPSDLSNPSEVYTDTVIAYDPDGVLYQLIPKVTMLQPAEHPKWFEPGDLAMIDWFF